MSQSETEFNISPLMEFFRQDKLPHEFPAHFHEHYTVGCLLRGERLFDCGGHAGNLVPNQLLIINPGQAHKCADSGKTSSAWLAAHFSVEALRRLAGKFEKSPSAPFIQPTVWRDNLALEKFLSLTAERTEENARGFLLYLLGAAREEDFENPKCAVRKSFPSVFNAICRELAERPDVSLSLDEMACRANMNKYSFLRKFKGLTGISPRRYQESLRLNLARKKLCEGQSVSRCAQNLGFYDQSHFTRQFTRNFGVTPGQLRKAARKCGSAQS